MIQGIINLIEAACAFLWGDLITLPLPGGGTLGISLLVMLLIPTGIYFTIRTRVLPIRLFRDEVDTVLKQTHHRDGLSSFQSLMISTATRVGMGNLVGVVAAVSAGGAFSPGNGQRAAGGFRKYGRGPARHRPRLRLGDQHAASACAHREASYDGA